MSTSIGPSIPRFADAFWDEQHYGVDVINQRLGNAKRTCEEIKKLYQVRSEMESDYGDRLLKLSQLIVGQDEDGTLAESLSHIPSALETTARAHMDLAQQLQHHLHSPLDSFIKEQNNLYNMKCQLVHDAIKGKEEANEHMIKAKKVYDSECDKLKEIYQYLQDYAASDDERLQAESDRDTCIESIKLAKAKYQQSIDTYNNHIRIWVDEWRGTCNMYQQLEEKRIRFVRSSLWAFANMMSSVYIVDDQCCERIRTALEITDVDKDIYTFVEKHGTGKSLPELVKFEDRMPTQHNVTPAYSDMERHNTIDIKTLPSMPPHDEQVPTPSVNSDPPPQPSEAMVFAAQAIENMIHDDIEKSQETPVTLSEHKLAPQHLPAMTQQGGDLDHSTDQQHEEDDGLDQSKQQQQEQPDVASLKKDDTKKQPSSIKSTESGQFRFKPVPNPTFSQQPSSAPVMNRQTSTENDQQLTQLISAAALVAEGVHHETDDTIHLTDDEEEEEQDKYRPPPKDEKWVISSIRRPQMVPVRSPNARVYDGTSPRSSMIRSSLVLPDHPPEATTSTSGGKANRPQLKIDIPNKETKVAAQEVIAAGRALAQNHQQQNDTMGIRPPPWQQQEEYRRQPYESTNYNNQRYSQQQGGLNRNVSGPRVAPDTITADNRKNTNKEFNKFIKGGRKSTLSPPPPPQEGPKHEPPNKKGGRFSLGIFGNKKDKRGPPPQRNTLPPTSDVFISGPPGGGPISTQPDNINNDNSNAVNTDSIPSNHPDLTSDGSPIMHYARAVWSFTATIPMEMSFSAGDRLAIVKKQADGWWDAELQGPTKTRGLVPGNYMEID